MSRSTIEKLRLLALLVAGAAAIGCAYSLILGTVELGPAMTGLIGASIGALIASAVIGFELFGAPRLLDRDGRRLPLPAALAMRTALYGFAIMAALLVLPWAYLGRAPIPFRPGLLGDIAFSLAATLIFVSLAAIAQLIGLGTLGNLLLARYYRPRAEQRIVLFLDMMGSTDVAERVGDIPFYAMLSDAFTRLSRVVTDSGGEVQACRDTGHAMLASGTLIGRVAMPDGIVATSLGAQRLRGKAADLELFALGRAGGPQSARTAVSWKSFCSQRPPTLTQIAVT